MACNLMLPHEDYVLNKFRIWNNDIFGRENLASFLAGRKTPPTIVPRPGVELPTSRTHRLHREQRVPRSTHSAKNGAERTRKRGEEKEEEKIKRGKRGQKKREESKRKPEMIDCPQSLECTAVHHTSLRCSNPQIRVLEPSNVAQI